MFIYIFAGGFPIFQGQKPTIICYCSNLISEPLVCCLKSCEFCPDFDYSFSIPYLCLIASKITILCLFVIFPTPFFRLWSLVWLVDLFIVCVPERRFICISGKKNSQHSRNTDRVPHVGYQGSTCRSWPLNLTSCSHVDLSFDLSFFMGSILWLYQTEGLFIMFAIETDVTENSYGQCSCTKDLKKENYVLTQLKSTVWLFCTLPLIIGTWVSFRYSYITIVFFFFIFTAVILDFVFTESGPFSVKARLLTYLIGFIEDTDCS